MKSKKHNIGVSALVMGFMATSVAVPFTAYAASHREAPAISGDPKADGTDLYALEVFNEGTGLGLYIVKTLLKEVKGTITCDSELNKGTTFKVTFPV